MTSTKALLRTSRGLRVSFLGPDNFLAMVCLSVGIPPVEGKRESCAQKTRSFMGP